MDQNKKEEEREHPFPEGYEHFSDMADLAAKQSREIDQQIKNIPKEDIRQTSYRLQFNPAGLTKAEEQWKKRLDKNDLEQQKKEVEATLNKRVDKELEILDVDPETSKEIRLAVMETMHPNPFRGKTREQLDVIKGMEKDPQHSQDYMRTLLRDHRESHTSKGSKYKGPDKD